MTIIEIVSGITRECFLLMGAMAPFLLFGFLFAGILKVLIPQEKIAHFLGRGKVKSALNASILGIPLPLCSCGVIPAAVSLRRQGANKGATLSFLISTPTTGIDSILATYGLLGGLFTIFRVVTSFVAAVVCGTLTNILFPSQEKEDVKRELPMCNTCGEIGPHIHTMWEKLRAVIHYAFFELVDDIGKWLLIGIILGGTIAYAVPQSLISRYLGSDFLSMGIMLLVGIPLYVCATGSIPIAAALMLKGMSPGAALVFLLCGPATNTVTITVIAKELGKREALLYLTIIALSAVGAGFILNSIWYSHTSLQYVPGGSMLPTWITYLSTIVLLFLLGFSFVKKYLFKEEEEKMEEKKEQIIFHVPDMSCQHCVAAIKQALEKIQVANARIDLKEKKVMVDKAYSSKKDEIIQSISAAGYNVIASEK